MKFLLQNCGEAVNNFFSGFARSDHYKGNVLCVFIARESVQKYQEEEKMDL